MNLNSWMVAQNAEKSYQKIPKTRIKDVDTSLLKQHFGLKQCFFRNCRVLEIGANMLSPVHSLNEASVKVGLDPLSKHYAKALPQSAIQIQGIGENLPFQNRCFDVVICTNVLDHTVEPKQVLEQINQCLRDDGVFLFSVDTFALPQLVRERVLARIDTMHPHHFSVSEVSFLLQQANFAVTMFTYDNQSFSYQLGIIKETLRKKRFLSAAKYFFAVSVFRLNYVFFRCIKR